MMTVIVSYVIDRILNQKNHGFNVKNVKSGLMIPVQEIDL